MTEAAIITWLQHVHMSFGIFMSEDIPKLETFFATESVMSTERFVCYN